ncbi:hypothetical protein [Nocardioides sambongensis]|uniref:hypothetical protein n=1 Tax=Nocardioides sambongensis TaxID=2589074 RepID=UPI0018C8AB8B|nr:hypothetical protein [Nocardioides sambongensis]
MATTQPGNRISLVPSNRARQPMHPARKRLIIAVLLVGVGSFLPWIYVGGVPKSGALGPGLWTFYGAMLGLAGVLLPFHKVGAVHAGLMAAAAIAVPAWQVLHLVGLVGLAGWMPGPGLVMVFGGGVVAIGCAVRLYRAPAPTAA